MNKEIYIWILQALPAFTGAPLIVQAVFFYVEGYYNRDRTHSALDYLAPNDYYSKKVA